MARVSVCDICGDRVKKGIGIKLPKDQKACGLTLYSSSPFDSGTPADVCAKCAAAIQETINVLSSSAAANKPENDIPLEVAELEHLTARCPRGNMDLY